jgi:hypothetical protein
MLSSEHYRRAIFQICNVQNLEITRITTFNICNVVYQAGSRRDPMWVFNFLRFFEETLYKSNYIIFMLSWCRTHTKIRSTSVVMVTTGSQKIIVWGPGRTPLGILRVKPFLKMHPFGFMFECEGFLLILSWTETLVLLRLQLFWKRNIILASIKHGRTSLVQKLCGTAAFLDNKMKCLMPNWVMLITLTVEMFVVGLLRCACVHRVQVHFWMEHQSTSSAPCSCSSCGCRSWHIGYWPVTSRWQVRWPWPCKGSG